MSKLCLGTYFAVIKACKSNAFVQKITFRDLFSNIYYEYDPDESVVGHLVRGDSNPSQEFINYINRMDSSTYLDIVECFDLITNVINDNSRDLLVNLFTALVSEDDTINGDTVVDLINETTKNEMPGKFISLESFLAGLFLYIIKNTDNKGMNDYVKEINVDFVARVKNKKKQSISDSSSNTHIEEYKPVCLSANEFLMRYEDYLRFVPLCHMAYVCKPYHKHNRQMYTEYNLLSDEDKLKVLKYCKCTELLSVDMDMLYQGLSFFIKDIEIFELSSKDLTYVFPQYFYRTIEYYSDRTISYYNLDAFIRLYTQSSFKYLELSKYSTLNQYIYDYLWFKKNEPSQIFVQPLNYLWEVQNLASCYEYDLTFWICRFIIDACNNINPLDIDKDIPHIFLEDLDIKTQEDLYYYAMVCLYNNCQYHLHN